MDFLKEILGEELFTQVSEKLSAHNETAENKIKIADLGTGSYVSRDKYLSKETELSSKVKELEEANNLISNLKKGNKDNESLQQKIADYDSQIESLQKELADTQIKAAVKVALMSEKALDIDYLTYKLNEKLVEKGEVLQLDENGNIKGWKDTVDGLKIQFPQQFDTAKVEKNIQENRLEKSDQNNGFTKQDILKMPYGERMKFAEENSEAYEQAMGRV